MPRDSYLQTEPMILQMVTPSNSSGTEAVFNEDEQNHDIVVIKPDGTIADPSTYIVSYPWTIGASPATLLVIRVTIQANHFERGLWTLFMNWGGSPLTRYQYIGSTTQDWGSTGSATVQSFHARQALTNKQESNSSTVPIRLYIYDDDGTTIIWQRDIANADGTPVNPKQVLTLGPIEPV